MKMMMYIPYPFNFSNFCRTKRPFSTCPSPLPLNQSFSSPTPANDDHKSLCFSLIDRLMKMGLKSKAQEVLERIIDWCSSSQEANSAVEFAVMRCVELDSRCCSRLILKLVDYGEPQLGEFLYMSRRVEPDCSLLNSMVVCYCKLGKLDYARSYFDRIIGMKLIPCRAACNTLILALCDQYRVLEGFDLFVKVSDGDVALAFSCYNRLLNGLCDSGHLDKALVVYNLMCDKGVRPTVHLFKSLIFGFCKGGRVFEAESLSIKMETFGLVMDKVLYTSLIRGYCKDKKMKMAMRLFTRMLKRGVEPDNYTYNTLIQGFGNIGLFDEAQVLFSNMAEFGLKPNVVTYQIMITNYCKYQKLDCALEHFRVMTVVPNVHCYTELIGALLRENRSGEAVELFGQMINNGIVPDSTLFFTLIRNSSPGREINLCLKVVQAIAKNGCGIDLSSSFRPTAPDSSRDIINEIENLLEEIIKRNILLANSAFDIYLMGLSAAGKLDKARRCYNKMKRQGLRPSVSACNSFIKCLLRKGLANDVGSLIDDMVEQGVFCNLATFLIIVDDLCKRGDLVPAFQLLDQLIVMGVKPSVAIYGTIVGRLIRERRIYEARDVFNTMIESGICPDETMFLAMISAFSRSGRPTVALWLFHRIPNYGFRPSSHAYTALISGLVKKKNIEKGRIYLVKMLEDGYRPDAVFCTSIMNHFLRKQEFKSAFKLVVDLMNAGVVCAPDSIFYNTLVRGFCKARKLHDALSLIHTMEKIGFSPSESSYESLLSLLCASHLSSLAFKICLDMVSHGYIPHRHHLNTVIDILSGDNKLVEAQILKSSIEAF